MNKNERMKDLVRILDEAARAYYQESREIMSNLEYDALYDELLKLEEETGIVMAGSPTHKVGYEILSELEKVDHDSPMLSLDKTKSPEDLRSWIGQQKGMLSWKMDGLTVVLTYENGVLSRAVTRGNGTTGEVITNNAKVFKNLPSRIPFEGQVVLRGEAIIHYSDFEKLNASILNVDSRYKNPRNLCSGSVRQLNNEITAKRNVYFYAFSLVSAEGREDSNSIEANMLWLKDMGFTIVPYKMVTADTIIDAIGTFSDQIAENDFPSDGLVLIYDDIAYGIRLGRTAKFPRNAIAFKWADEQAETTLLEIEWSPSRTGLINPVAIFEPVELEGTTVSRASLHNISIIEGLELGEGDKIKVYKANMIIPQVSENLTRSGHYPIASHCPACGGETEIRMENDVKSLYCANPFCSAKKIKLLSHFVGRDAMNIDGLSEATLTKMVDKGYIEELYDIYRLDRFEEGIIEMEGFGEKSYQKLYKAIQASRKTELFRFVYSLGILNIGSSNAKLLCKYFGNSLEKLREASVAEMVEIDGIGEAIAQSVRDYFDNEHNQKMLEELLPYITFEEKEELPGEEQSLEGKTFVITGSVNHFKNRKELKERIESLGGKVTGSVTSKTDYLINNDNMSSSSKNKKAKELEVAIITEEEFLGMLS